MLAPGVPTAVAHDIAAHAGDPKAMAKAVVDRTMDATFGFDGIDSYGPAAAFDVIDLAADKTTAVATAIRTLDADLVSASDNRSVRAAIREDAKAIDGMVRFPGSQTMPWRADRPAIALYDTLSQDGRLPETVRADALHAKVAVAATVLAHRESDDFAAFHDADYSNAAGPTVHFPVSPRQIDPWAAGGISETDNAFYKSVGAADLTRALA